MVHGAASAVQEFALDQRVVSYGQRSVAELFAKISAADLVIAPDSFALHLASLYDVPAVGYFGPAHPLPLSANRTAQCELVPTADVFPMLATERE